jgi:hypothetical protein
MTRNCWNFKAGKSKRWMVCAMALLSFIAGSLITARLAHIDRVRADSNRIFDASHLSHSAGQGARPRVAVSRHDFQAASQARPECRRLLGARGNAGVGQHIHFPRGSFQPGRGEKELGRDDGRPGVSGGNQNRAGQQAGRKGRPNVHATNGFFTGEVVHIGQASDRIGGSGTRRGAAVVASVISRLPETG